MQSSVEVRRLTLSLPSVLYLEPIIYAGTTSCCPASAVYRDVLLDRVLKPTKFTRLVDDKVVHSSPKPNKYYFTCKKVVQRFVHIYTEQVDHALINRYHPPPTPSRAEMRVPVGDIERTKRRLTGAIFVAGHGQSL